MLKARNCYISTIMVHNAIMLPFSPPPPPPAQVMIYFPKEHPLGEVVMHQCQDSDFTSMMVRSCDALQAQLEELRQQVALVVKVEGSSTVQEVSR